MSVVITASGNHGPFKFIEVLADRLRCDGTDLPFLVIGAYSISEDDDLAPVAAPLDTSELRAEVWSAIKIERDRRKFGGILIGGYWFHTDLETRSQLSILDGKAQRSGWPNGTVLHPAWKTMSGEKTPMTLGLLRQILDGGITKEGQIFDIAEAHRVAMEASGDPSGYDYLAGWPAIYVPEE